MCIQTKHLYPRRNGSHYQVSKKLKYLRSKFSLLKTRCLNVIQLEGLPGIAAAA